MKYEWTVNKIDVKPHFQNLENFVYIIYWDYIANNESGFTSSINGFTEFNSEVDSDTYIPYENITKDIVDHWLNTSTNVNQLQSILNKKIEDLINPPIINLPLPWIPNPTPTPISTPIPTVSSTSTPTPTTIFYVFDLSFSDVSENDACSLYPTTNTYYSSSSLLSNGVTIFTDMGLSIQPNNGYYSDGINVWSVNSSLLYGQNLCSIP